MNDQDTPATFREHSAEDSASDGGSETSIALGADTPPADAAHDSLAAIEQSLENPDHAGSPIVDVDEYIQAQENRAQRSRRLLQFGIPVAAVVLVFGALKISGRLSTNGVTALVREKQMQQSQNASAPPVASTAGSPTDSKAISAPAEALFDADVPIVRTKPDSAVADDLKNYLYHEMPAISPSERAAFAALIAAMNQKPKNKERFLRVVQQTIVPSYRKFLTGAANIHPKTPAVQNAHKLLLRSAEINMEAFSQLSKSGSDAAGYWQIGVDAEFKAGTEFANQFRKQLDALSKDQGVKLPWAST